MRGEGDAKLPARGNGQFLLDLRGVAVRRDAVRNEPLARFAESVPRFRPRPAPETPDLASITSRSATRRPDLISGIKSSNAAVG